MNLQPFGANIEAVSFIKANESAQVSPEQIKQKADALDQDISTIFGNELPKQTIKSQVIVTDNIVDWVDDYCKSNAFDLIIKAGNRTESLFHTPCDWELIRRLQVPVLIASQQQWRQKPAILAAVDPATTDDVQIAINNEILNWTKLWGQTFDCDIHIVYCLPVSNILKELDIIDVEEYAQTHRVEAEEKLNHLMSGHDLPNVTTHVTAGTPERAIPHCANQLKAELVVMGSTGKTGIKGMLFGNIAEKVMHNLRTNSLIIESVK